MVGAAGRGGADGGENAGADDGADAERGELHGAERALQAAAGMLGVADEAIERLDLEQCRHGRPRALGEFGYISRTCDSRFSVRAPSAGTYGAKLSHTGHEVVFIARGAHLKAIRERGLCDLRSVLGDLIVRARAEEDPAAVGPVDVVLVTVKAYDNEKALASLAPLIGPQTTVLTLQNGVESAEQVAALAGEANVIAGSAYIATAIRAPGLIEQTGTHRRIVFGEWFGDRTNVSSRVAALHKAFAAADIESEPHADSRPRIWEKFIWLAPLAAVCAAARQPTSALQNDPALRATLLAAVREADALARAEGIAVSPDIVEQGTIIQSAAAVDAAVDVDRSLDREADGARSPGGSDRAA